MTNKSLVMSHGDLDGCVGAMVCQKYIKKIEGDDHEVVIIPCSYENVNEYARNAFENYKEYKHIHVVDICFNEQVLKIMPENAVVMDHHDTSRFIIGKKNCYWSEKYCGAVVAWKHLFPGEKMTKPFNKLMGIANEYDMWIGEKGPSLRAHNLNVIFRFYRFRDFFDRYYDGFENFTTDENKYLKSYWDKQKEILDATDKIDYGGDVILFIASDDRLDANYWCNHFLHEENFNVIVMTWPHKNRISMRSSGRIDWFHSGYWLRDNIVNANDSKGGHQKAAGCSTEGMSEEDILNIGVKIQELISSKKLEV